MKNITVNKEKLLEALTKNMAIHIDEYSQMKIVYMEMAVVKGEEILDNLRSGDYKTNLYFDLDKPNSSEKEYKRAIEMLAWEVNVNVTITENEYNSYINDEWSFSRNFAVSKLAYLEGR